MYQRTICHVLGCNDRLVIAVQRNVKKVSPPPFYIPPSYGCIALQKRAGSVTVRHCRILTVRDAYFASSSQVRAVAMLLPTVANKKNYGVVVSSGGIRSNRVV